ncbi:hypothetical protein Tco_1101266 [Tanacetum coccineum]
MLRLDVDEESERRLDESCVASEMSGVEDNIVVELPPRVSSCNEGGQMRGIGPRPLVPSSVSLLALV